MRYIKLLGVILLLQSLFFVHLLHTLHEATLEGRPVAIPATGGTVTEVQLSETPYWGGIWGQLTSSGATTVNSSSGSILDVDLLYNDTDNTCMKTQLFAAQLPVSASAITSITPVEADQILGLDGIRVQSLTRTFDELLTYDIGGQSINLWSVRTNSPTGQYLQGVAQASGNLVFVVETKRNAQAFNGENANYQFMLPPGTWDVTYDSDDTCAILDNVTLLSEEVAQERTLTIAAPDRLCVGQENIFYAALVAQRTYCSASEVGVWYCSPAQDAQVSVQKGGTDYDIDIEDGQINFTPPEDGRYIFTARTTNLTSMKTIRAETCLPYSNGLVSGGGRTIVYDAPDLQAGTFAFGDRVRQESPAGAGLFEQAQLSYAMIIVLTFMAFIVGIPAYFVVHKDDSLLSLQLRVWWMERKARLASKAE